LANRKQELAEQVFIVCACVWISECQCSFTLKHTDHHCLHMHLIPWLDSAQLQRWADVWVTDWGLVTSQSFPFTQTQTHTGNFRLSAPASSERGVSLKLGGLVVKKYSCMWLVCNKTTKSLCIYSVSYSK